MVSEFEAFKFGPINTVPMADAITGEISGPPSSQAQTGKKLVSLRLCVDLVLTAIEGLPRSTVAASLQLARSVNVLDVQAVSNISRFEYDNNAKPPNTQE